MHLIAGEVKSVGVDEWKRGSQLTFTSDDLFESRSNLGVDRVLSHDEDYGHTSEAQSVESVSTETGNRKPGKKNFNLRFVDERQRPVFEFTR